MDPIRAFDSAILAMLRTSKNSNSLSESGDSSSASNILLKPATSGPSSQSSNPESSAAAQSSGAATSNQSVDLTTKKGQPSMPGTQTELNKTGPTSGSQMTFIGQTGSQQGT